MAGWQDLLDAGMAAGKEILNFQFQKKAMRQAESLARKQARAGMGGSMLPGMGLGYASQPQYGMQPVMGFGAGGSFGSGPMIQNPIGDYVNGMLGVQDFSNVQSGSSSMANGCFRTSTPGAPRVSPCREITAVGPDGKQYSWIYRGRPVLYSGDLAHCKRVGKILSRAGRKSGRARFR